MKWFLLIFPRQCSNTLNGINFQSATWKWRPQIPLPVMGFAHLALEDAQETSRLCATFGLQLPRCLQSSGPGTYIEERREGEVIPGSWQDHLNERGLWGGSCCLPISAGTAQFPVGTKTSLARIVSLTFLILVPLQNREAFCHPMHIYHEDKVTAP